MIMSIDFLSLVMLGLVTWRLTSLLVDESGPFDMFAKFRSFIGVYYDDWSEKQGRNTIARAFTCFWCASVWVATAVALLAGYYSSALEFFTTVIAFSALAIIINRILD